jgi:hypothetical protein
MQQIRRVLLLYGFRMSPTFVVHLRLRMTKREIYAADFQ